MATSYNELLQQFEQWLRVERNLAERTRKAYLYDLSRLGEFLIVLHGKMPPLATIKADALREYLNHMQLERGCRSATLARVIASIRAAFDFAVMREILATSPAAQLRSPKQAKKLPIYLTAQELARLLQAPNPEEAGGWRDRAMLTTLAFTGLRLSEIVGINLRDVDLRNHAVRVLGKGSKERIVPLNDVVVDALNKYLDVRALTDDRAFFLSKFARRMTGRAVENIVRKYALSAGIFREGISPHKLRHTFATLLHASEVDLIEIKELMGHANIASTQIYTHTSSAQLRAAVKKLEKI